MMICKKCSKEIGNAAECPYCGAIVLMDPLPHHLPAGTLIGGRFAVEGVLGEGGFGITYLTRDNKLGSLFAVKEYYPRGISYRDQTGTNTVYVSSKDDTDFYDHGKKRFLSEARTLARFSEEPGVVSVTDYIEENDTVYLVMEYLRGETLQKYLKKNNVLSADEAFAMLEPIIRTLEKIHASGIIHRDISPDNIMVLKNGTLKLMDFGAAKEFIDDNRSMSVMLKKGYAPMEQYRRNGKQGPWTDVYALCATIYRCITGKTPDDALDRVVEDNLQKPSAIGAKITPAQEQVLLYGLSVHQQDRCQNMTELLRLWEQAKTSEVSGLPTANSSVSSARQANASKPNAVVSNGLQIDPNATVYAEDYTNIPGTPVNAADRRNNSVPVSNQQIPAQYPQAPAPKKKSKKGIVIGVIAAVLVIAIAVSIVAIKPWELLNGGGSGGIFGSSSQKATEYVFETGTPKYTWKVTKTVWNNKQDDKSTNIKQSSKSKKIYLHFKLECSPSGGSFTPVIKIHQPDGSESYYAFTEAVTTGWSWYAFAYDDPEKAKTGPLTMTVYDTYGNELYSGSVEIVD